MILQNFGEQPRFLLPVVPQGLSASFEVKKYLDPEMSNDAKLNKRVELNNTVKNVPCVLLHQLSWFCSDGVVVGESMERKGLVFYQWK